MHANVLVYRWSVLGAEASPIEVVCSFQTAHFLSLRAILVPALRYLWLLVFAKFFWYLWEPSLFAIFDSILGVFLIFLNSFYLQINGKKKISCSALRLKIGNVFYNFPGSNFIARDGQRIIEISG